jgi:hypothetical protein
MAGLSQSHLADDVRVFATRCVCHVHISHPSSRTSSAVEAGAMIAGSGRHVPIHSELGRGLNFAGPQAHSGELHDGEEIGTLISRRDCRECLIRVEFIESVVLLVLFGMLAAALCS